ncbi:hypothetical protein ABCR94_23045 [Streptomyces sp. 21So2-11]|uniref:hypothetical protein n=1 Tax=Streptomyces sp. 21So2-11 TaxID=3144408 RepID=UPI003219C1B0
MPRIPGVSGELLGGERDMTAGVWIEQIVARCGTECHQILGEVAEDEAAIRRPVENLLSAAATHFGLELHLHPEARRPDLGIRPDLAARVGRDKQHIVGYIELKSPEKLNINPGACAGTTASSGRACRGFPI